MLKINKDTGLPQLLLGPFIDIIDAFITTHKCKFKKKNFSDST